MTPAPLPAFLDRRQICAALGISKASLYRRIADGTFPPPRKFGATSRWPLAEVLEVLNKLPTMHDAAA